jgi:cell wall-associated NlpC family hydrolase
VRTGPLFVVALLLALGACATRPPSKAPTFAPALPAGAASSPGAGSTDAATTFVDTATSMLGQPYRWGGAAPGGFDCSGLVAYAAGRAGLQVPRTAQEQLHSGVAISRREVRAGDLVFLHLAHKEMHVGIAIDADRFVHAPSSGGHVRIDSLAAPPYARKFIQARRILIDAAQPLPR